MSEHPIIFSAPMVRAIIDGRKTQTRRIVKPQPDNYLRWNADWLTGHIRCPYGQPGDRLWVRETWSCAWNAAHGHGVRFVADNHFRCFNGCCNGRELSQPGYDWLTGHYGNGAPEPNRPSIHMPLWASRITLEVTGVRVERLQEISEQDAIREGMPPLVPGFHGDGGWARDKFVELWGQINAKRAPWASNPFVWVVEFRQIEKL